MLANFFVLWLLLAVGGGFLLFFGLSLIHI